MLRATRRGLLVGASIGFLALAGRMLPMTASSDADAQELEEVRFGLGPYFEYQPWAISKDLGLDKEMGFDFVLQTVNKVAHAVAGLQSGAVSPDNVVPDLHDPLLRERPHAA